MQTLLLHKLESSPANSCPGKKGKERRAASIFQLYLMEEVSISKITWDSVSFFVSSRWAKCNP